MTESVRIDTVIDGRHVPRAEVLRWEGARITAAADKLGVTVPSLGHIGVRREELLRRKLELGQDGITRRLARETRWADRTARLQSAVTTRRRTSTVDLRVAGGGASHFVQWFENASQSGDDTALLRGCPDHFVIRTAPDGRQDVCETPGGSPLAARFRIDYQDISSLVTTIDQTFPHQIAGVALAGNGQPIGGVRHQFRDTPDGFEARLTVEFPFPTLWTMIAGHRWHLACEFSNWIVHANT
ncbi:hypothetical protein ASG56_05885 [Rhodococcus sp. Leaf7]|uniref:hypothetical protein n=1 Tax=unclassified Rhodococcus (in: high G+C Gram-positive bacteria) TaxID=192944 RepID=UPI0006F2C909|nr:MULTISPECIES: hypothetical protein [unclassified Rhodococcus (in: high G+C Gram-positive bacteria)]KQU07081.1 hypothetical protein ASG56_05885 [Rhodococcus sp. Leaf7]KQU42599.1 hypothetical protein ASG64_05885 [Rhodococcus sp. Leaf247]